MELKMLNLGFMKLLSFAMLIVAAVQSEWVYHVGLRDVAISKGKNYDVDNGAELSLRNSAMIPIGGQQRCDLSKKLMNSAFSLVELGGSYYYFGIHFKTNFFKAMQFCRSHGMALLSIESSEENSRILNYLTTNYNDVEHFWTSGSDLGQEGKFVWLATGNPQRFSYWKTPQPSNTASKEHCMEIWKVNGDRIWNDIPCANEYNFICEVQECNALCKDKNC